MNISPQVEQQRDDVLRSVRQQRAVKQCAAIAIDGMNQCRIGIQRGDDFFQVAFGRRYVDCVLINYPAAEKRQWDAVVTRVSHTLSGG